MLSILNLNDKFDFKLLVIQYFLNLIILPWLVLSSGRDFVIHCSSLERLQMNYFLEHCFFWDNSILDMSTHLKIEK